MELLSSGITWTLFHVPQAYWKKSTHGSIVKSMEDNKDEAETKNNFSNRNIQCYLKVLCMLFIRYTGAHVIDLSNSNRIMEIIQLRLC